MRRDIDRHLSIILHSLWAIVAVVLMIVAAMYDLKISQAMSNDESYFGIIFATLGEVPAYMIVPVCGVLLMRCDFHLKRVCDILVQVASGLLTFGGYIIWSILAENKIESVPIAIAYCILLTLGSFAIGRLIPRENATKYIRWCIFAIAVLIVSLILVNTIKAFWGRVRYRDLILAESYEQYTPWYSPQGITGHKSFPSGHTTSAANLFVFATVFDMKPNLRRYRRLAYIVTFLFTILTALSRIVISAHYLSDVVVGGTLSYIAFYVLKKVILTRISNKNTEPVTT